MIHLNKGNPFPLGSSLTSQGVNFSLIATNAEFVELFVGAGAARVRDLFEQAKKKAP